VSQIWKDFDSNIIKTSFDKCGITTQNTERLHKGLRFVLNQNELPKTILTDLPDDNDVDGFSDCEFDEEDEDEDDDGEDQDGKDQDEDEDEEEFYQQPAKKRKIAEPVASRYPKRKRN
jgi:hypothetical protein